MIKAIYFLGLLISLISTSAFSQKYTSSERDFITLKTFEIVDSLVNEKEYMVAFNKLYDLKQTALSSKYTSEFYELSQKVNTLSNLSVAIKNVEISLRNYEQGKKNALILAQKFYFDALRIAQKNYKVKINSDVIANLPSDTINLNRLEGFPLNLYFVDEAPETWAPGDKDKLGIAIDSSLFQGIIRSTYKEKDGTEGRILYHYSDGKMIKKENFELIYKSPYYRNKHWNLLSSEKISGDTTMYYFYEGDNHFVHDTFIYRKNESLRSYAEYFGGRCAEKLYIYTNELTDSLINHNRFFDQNEKLRYEEVFRTNKDSTFKFSRNYAGDTVEYMMTMKGNNHGTFISSRNWGGVDGSDGVSRFYSNWEHGRLLSVKSENALFMDKRGKSISEEKFIKQCGHTRNKRLTPLLEILLNEKEQPITSFLVFDISRSEPDVSLEKRRTKSIEKHKDSLLEELEKK